METLIAEPNQKHLKLSPKLQQIGLHVLCNLCKGEPCGGICVDKNSPEGIKGKLCKSPERHVFRVRFHIPGTKSGKKTKVLGRDNILAAKEAIQLYEEFKSGKQISEPQEEPQQQFSYFLDYILKYLDFNRNPTKNRIANDKSTITDYELHFDVLMTAISEKGINPNSLKIEKLDNKLAQVAFNHLVKNFKGRTCEKYFKTYRTFYNYLLKEEQLILPANPFQGWHFEKEELKNEIIYENEFTELLKAVDEKPNFLNEKTGRKRIMYFDFVKDGFSLALYSGARRQEIPEIKWSDIIPNRKTGEIRGGVLLLKDMKNMRIQKLSTVKLKPIEINDDLWELLIKMGYEQFKGQDKYILDPDEKYGRRFIKDSLSKSFAHYISFVDTKGRQLSFKCFRKTWFTGCAGNVGQDLASYMGGHSETNVTATHYINKLELAGAAGKFKRVFSKE